MAATQALASTRREEVLALAAQLFASRGYTQTTVRHIADSAGILSGSLYYHFKSKEEMLDEILRGFMDDLYTESCGVLDSSDSPGQQLDDLVRISFRYIHDRPQQVALYQNEYRTVAAFPGFEFVAEISEKVGALWVDVLTRGRDQDVFRSDLDVHLVHRFLRESVWSGVRWYRPEGKHQHDVVADQFLAMLHGGLFSSATS